MNFKQLYYFKRLSETEHYTEAASSLFITQPSLSHAIAELEKELGVSLFFRQGRNVRISESGKCFLPYVETALSALENGRERLKNNHLLCRENIRIGFIYTMGEYVIPQIINNYSQHFRHNDVTFSFKQGTSVALLQSLKADKVDMVICSRIGDDPDIEFIPVIEQELVVVTAKDHPLARLHESDVDLAETIHYPYVYFSESSGLRPFIDDIFHQQTLSPDIACYVEEDLAMAGLVSIGYGIAIMPRIAALTHYNLHILTIKNSLPPRYICLATIKTKMLSPAALRLKNFIITHSDVARKHAQSAALGMSAARKASPSSPAVV